MAELVLMEHIDGVTRLTLNHPEKRNALSRAMLGALEERLAAVRDDERVRAVILRAAGPVFSAGHDLKELAAGSEGELRQLFAVCTRVMELLPALPQPVIAEVHALATAAGCQLVTSCDLVIASVNASFATPGVKIGLFCTTPGVPLARAVPAKKALEMLFTGEPVTADEAERLGLVNRAVPAERLEEETLALARKIATASRAVLARGKQAFYRQVALDRAGAYAVAEPLMVQHAQAADCREGIAAFFAKRPPQWPTDAAR
jgi:enoyl-CoA hydratase/carnithine racemase